MESYRRIRSEERETILVLVQNGENQADRVKALGENQSSLSRELAKGLEKRVYNPFLAQRETEKRAVYSVPEVIAENRCADMGSHQ